MEQSFKDKILNEKFKELNKAIVTFSKSMGVDLGQSKFDEFEVDVLKSGQIQKFEYSLELSWKFLKSFLRREKGLDAQGPKDVFRQFAKYEYFSQNEIQVFLNMVDDRNRIAHEYRDYIMEKIYPKLKDYQVLMKKIVKLDYQTS